MADERTPPEETPASEDPRRPDDPRRPGEPPPLDEPKPLDEPRPRRRRKSPARNSTAGRSAAAKTASAEPPGAESPGAESPGAEPPGAEPVSGAPGTAHAAAGTPEGAPPTPPVPPAPPAQRERKWLPVVALLAVMGFVSLGGFFTAEALEEELPPIEVGEGLTIRPPAGWEVASQLDQPAAGVRLSNGTGNVDAFAQTTDRTADDLYRFYITEFLAGDAQQLRFVEQPESFTTSTGFQGVRGFYIGVFNGVAVPIEGEVSVFVGPGGVGVLFDVWGPEGQLGTFLDEAREMIDTAELG